MTLLSIFIVRVLISSIVMSFLACVDIEPPKILKLQWQLNWLYSTTNKKISNLLSIYVELNQENPRFFALNLTLDMPEKELLWNLIPNDTDPSKTITPTYSGNFSLLGQQLLPKGKYRLQLESNNKFLLDDKKLILDYTPPKISDFPFFNEDVISTQNDQPLIILVYRNNQFFMLSYITPHQKIPKGVDGNVFYLYTYDSNLKAGLITGPY